MKLPFFPLKTSLRVKLTIPFVGIALLPLALIILIAIPNLQGMQREQTAQLSRLAAQQESEEILAFIELQLEVLKNIGTVHPEFSQDPVIRDILLERFLHRSGAFLDIALLNAQGREVARKNLVEVITPEDLRDLGETFEFQQIRNKDSYVGPFLIARGKPFFVLGREIRGAEGTFQGAVLAQVDARILQDVVTRISRQESSLRTYIVNQQGTVIAHPDISEVLAERDFSSIPPVQAFVHGNTVETTQTYTNETGEHVLGTGILFNKEERLSMVERWLIVVEQPTGIALAPVRKITWSSFLILGSMLLLSVAGAVFVANSLARPIRELQKGAQQIGLGNLDYAFHVDTNDEVQELATELDKMRLRLKEIRTREENLSKLKSEFVSIVAHQLRTPLSAIKWAIALFVEAQGKLSKAQRGLLEKMEGSNERMIRLVNDLLDAARIEEGKFVYNKKRVAIEKLIASSIQALGQKSAQKNVRVIFHVPQEPLPPVFVDKKAMELVLQNLLENAIHYTPAAGTVHITASRSGSYSLLISVEDTGIGIPEQEKERIFSKFFRGTNAVKRETEGSGLGLFIVKNIVQAHGGKIWFESTQGKGATFHFTIPIN